jgi:hypothetical protein
MNIENPDRPDPRIAALARSESATPPPGDPTVQRCPYAENAHPAPKPPLRVLMWNILELGGGFYQPAVRPAYAIEAYARLIKELKIDICVILGITRTVGALPAPAEKGSGEPPNHVMADAAANTGPKEVMRILAKLQELDSAGSWVAQFLKEGDEYLYHENSTTCFLLRTAAPLTFTKLDVINSKVAPKVGLTGKLLCATLQVETHKNGPLHVIAPLGTLNPRRPPPQAGRSGVVPGPAATIELPESSLIAVSAPGDLFADRSAFSAFRLDVDATYTMPAAEGSLLRDDFWRSATERADGLLTNFAAIGLDDIVLQNENMHWSAMDEPAHAATLPEVIGYRADALLVSHAGSSGKPAVQEMRVVDMIKAALPADRIAALAPPADPSTPAPTTAQFPREDAVLQSARAAAATSRSGPEPQAAPVNELAECRYFSQGLSTHWPVVAQFQWT